MSTSVGSVDVKFTGDATGATKAAAQVGASVVSLDRKLDALVSSMGASTSATHAAVAAFRADAEAARKAAEAASSLDTEKKKVAKSAAVVEKAMQPVTMTASRAAEAVGKMRAGYSTLAATMGSSIPVVNNATGALQAMVASFGVGGGLGLLATAAAVGITALVTSMQEEEKAHEKAAEAARKHAGEMAELQAKIDGVGKSAVEQARLLAGASAAVAMQGFLASDEGKDIIERETELERKAEAPRAILRARPVVVDGVVNLVSLRASEELKEIEEELAKVVAEREAITGRINEKYAKTIELAAKTDGEEKRKKALDETKKKLDEIRDAWEKLNAIARSPRMGDAGFAGAGPTALAASWMLQDQFSSMPMMQGIDWAGVAEMAKASEHAAGVVEVSTDALEKEIAALDEHTMMIVDETIAFDDLMSEVRELEGEFYDISQDIPSFRDRLGKFADEFVSLTSSIMSGSAFSDIGAQVGSAIGSAIYGSMGGAIGGVIGGVLGSFADELVNVLGVLTPLFDGLGKVVGSLQPIFVVVRETFAALDPVWSQLAAIVLIVARVLAAWMVPLVRLVQVVALVVASFLTVVSGLGQFFTVLVVLAHNIDLAVGQRVVLAMESFYNALVTMVNALVDSVRMMPGFSEFGVKLNTIDIETGSIIDLFEQDMLGSFFEEIGLVDVLEENTAAIEDNTAAYTFSTTNIPAGYKAALTAYRVETPGPSTSNAGLGLATGGLFAGAIINVNANSESSFVQQMLAAGRRWGRMGSSPSGGNGGGN